MRFAALGGSNVGDYAAAGKAVADSAAKTFAVQRKTGPDYGKLSQVAMVTASEEKMSAMKASAQVAKAGINAYETNVKQGNKIAVFNKDQDIKSKQKMAGGVAAIGKMVGAGVLMKDNTKGREAPKADYQGLLDSHTSTRDGIKTRHDQEREELGTFEAETYKPSSGKATSGDSTVTGPGNLKPSETGQAYMKKLTESGMSKTQAAALVGHLKVESDNFQADTEYAPNAYGTRGRGHLQWTDLGTTGGRRTNFEAFAKKNNLSPTSFEANSQFLLSELQGNHGNQWTNGGSYEGFMQTSNINDASSYLQSNYIRPSKQYAHTDRRLQGAHAAYNAYQ